MRDMHLLLEESEEDWRRILGEKYRLWRGINVNKTGKDDFSFKHDWSFSTDLESISALIYNSDNLVSRFREEVVNYWDCDSEGLALDVLEYLLFHELYHFIEAPFSAKDNKMIHQAIRNGLLAGEPGLSPLKQVIKVNASQNMVKDFILDNRFYLDNNDYVLDDVIPVWDFLELLNEKPKDNAYTITRLAYAYLYGSEKACSFFDSKVSDEGRVVCEKSISALINHDFSLDFFDRKKVSKNIREVFAGSDRYSGIERFMSVLGPYINAGELNVRQDHSVSISSLLQDLISDMSSNDASSFLNSVINESSANASGSDVGSVNPVSDIDLFAMHEFYKLNHPVVKLVGGGLVGETVSVGKHNYWDLTRSSVIPSSDFQRLNIDRIKRFQERFHLPVLIDLGNGCFRLNEYSLKERSVKDVVFVDSRIDVPEVVEFYVDSSGSMYNYSPNSCSGFNDGSRWDMLSHVVYGLADALSQASVLLHKSCSLRFHNFAGTQVSSDITSVSDFLKGDVRSLKCFFKPENGYSTGLCVAPVFDGKQRAYMIITDGDINNPDREYSKLKDIARSTNNRVVLFEIGGTYALGEKVGSDPGDISYCQVHNKKDMFEKGLEVLISK